MVSNSSGRPTLTRRQWLSTVGSLTLLALTGTGIGCTPEGSATVSLDPSTKKRKFSKDNPDIDPNAKPKGRRR